MSMHIEAVAEEAISPQARTYAEYRVFAALARVARHVRRARIVLRRVDRDGCESVACTVTIALEASPPVRIRATGGHAYAAINRAVERISTATARPATETFQIDPTVST